VPWPLRNGVVSATAAHGNRRANGRWRACWPAHRANPMTRLRFINCRAAALAVTRRYLLVMAGANFAWEVVQLPLYTIWHTASWAYLGFATLHCWVGDLLIAAAAFACGALIAGRFWPMRGYVRAGLLIVVLGIAYTVFSEWLNVVVRGSWAYTPTMPRVPPLGTGLAPLLQWLLLPTMSLVWARGALLSVKVANR
jgi:hypothetical protein